jgi:hypothetical protein
MPDRYPSYFHRSPVYTPVGYKESDFADLIEDLQQRYAKKLSVENGAISFKIFSKGEYFERFGKKFYIHICAAFGQVYISIVDQNDAQAMQGIVDQLEEEITRLGKKLDQITQGRDIWCKRWMNVRQGIKQQKREIKKMLIDMGIEIKPGSPLSKLLRIDNIPF